jgi:UDP-GlcNAc:undecaprenyl-phosphate GlcNAc-1-phosphate transferase
MTVVAVALALGLVLTPTIRALARRWGLVARPRADRWHKQPTALFGGVAIFATVAVTYLVFFPWEHRLLVIMGASSLMWLVGALDDLVSLKPYQKLIGQVMASALVVCAGLHLPWTAWPALNMAITVFWLVGITNAVNLLDNMDGLAGGIVAIASGFLVIHFLLGGQPDEALLLAVFAAALVGFLAYNRSPASIFMGDCGSLFIGFFIASAALLNMTERGSSGFLSVLAVPVLTVFIPIFDTTLVSVMRKLSGRAVSQGGRDHASHRLVALGMSERHAVALLYGLATLSGLLALLMRMLPLDVALAAILGFTVVLTLLGVHLAGVRVYTEDELRASHQQPLVTFLIDLSHKRRLFEVLLDVALISLAYYLSHALVFGPVADSETWSAVLAALPILIIVKMGTFLALGVYRGLWRYVSVGDFVVHARAVAVASGLSLVILWFAFPDGSRAPAVFVLDGLLPLVLLSGSRMAFRLFRSLLPVRSAGSGRRVLIYGAGDAGELLLRELSNNASWKCILVGLLDDDPLKKGRLMHGFPVFGGNGSFLKICQEQRVEEVIISSSRFSDRRLEEILAECRKANIALKRLRLEIEGLHA